MGVDVSVCVGVSVGVCVGVSIEGMRYNLAQGQRVSATQVGVAEGVDVLVVMRAYLYRVGQNRTYPPCMTVYLGVSLPNYARIHM